MPNHVFMTKIQTSSLIKKIARQIKGKNKEETLKNAYFYVINHFSNEKYLLVLNFWKISYMNVDKLLRKKQFVHCTVQNNVLINILVNTGLFKESDFKRKWTITNFGAIHQYVVADIKGKKIKIDTFIRIFKEIN